MNEVQEVILNIYKNVSSICNNNGIPYFAIGGTCLGAVRHKGFIPWDDDLDIAIPIQYYDLFWSIMEKELPNNLKTYTCKEIKQYRYIFGKIHDIDTAFIEHSEVDFPNSYKGIFIDIMPLSAIPDDNKQRKKFYCKINNYYKLNFIRRYPLSAMDSVKKRLIWFLMRPFCMIIGPNYYSDKWLSLLKKYPLGSTQLTGYTWSTMVNNLTFPNEFFSNSVDLVFEDTSIPCPELYHDYLSAQFGDYMIFPPENERAPHYSEVVDVNESYRKYIKE